MDFLVDIAPLVADYNAKYPLPAKFAPEPHERVSRDAVAPPPVESAARERAHFRRSKPANDFVLAALHVDQRVQRFRCDATGGNFTLSLEGNSTASIAASATASDIQTALRAVTEGRTGLQLSQAVVSIAGPRPRQACTMGGHTTVVVHLATENATYSPVLAPVEASGVGLTGGSGERSSIVRLEAQGELAGTTTVPVVDGIAAFKDLSITGASSAGHGYVLQFTTFPGGLPLTAPVRSTRFDVAPSDPVRVALVAPPSALFGNGAVVPPAGVQVGERIDEASAVRMQILDAAGNVVPGESQAARISLELLQDDAVSIDGITRDAAATVTAVRHGFLQGDSVVLRGISGMAKLNERTFVVGSVVSVNQFRLEHSFGNAVDTSAANGFDAYTEGGTARRLAHVKRSADSYRSMPRFDQYANKGAAVKKRSAGHDPT